MTVSGLPRGELRRIDKLAVRAHRFHQFAHHPLCDAYGDEVFRFGRRARVCKGCTLAFLGTSVGVAPALATCATTLASLEPATGPGALVALVGVSGMALIALVGLSGTVLIALVGASGTARAAFGRRAQTGTAAPPLGAARGSKWSTRFVPCAALSYVSCCGGLYCLAHQRWWMMAALAMSAATVATCALRAYRKRGPHREPCTACPHRASLPACPGWAPIVRRERAFRRRSGALLDAAVAGVRRKS